MECEGNRHASRVVLTHNLHCIDSCLWERAGHLVLIGVEGEERLFDLRVNGNEDARRLVSDANLLAGKQVQRCDRHVNRRSRLGNQLQRRVVPLVLKRVDVEIP